MTYLPLASCSLPCTPYSLTFKKSLKLFLLSRFSWFSLRFFSFLILYLSRRFNSSSSVSSFKGISWLSPSSSSLVRLSISDYSSNSRRWSSCLLVFFFFDLFRIFLDFLLILCTFCFLFLVAYFELRSSPWLLSSASINPGPSDAVLALSDDE